MAGFSEHATMVATKSDATIYCAKVWTPSLEFRANTPPLKEETTPLTDYSRVSPKSLIHLLKTRSRLSEGTRSSEKNWNHVTPETFIFNASRYLGRTGSDHDYPTRLGYPTKNSLFAASHVQKIKQKPSNRLKFWFFTFWL